MSAGEAVAIQKNLADCSNFIWSEGGANWRASNSNASKYDSYFTAVSGTSIGSTFRWTATEGYFQSDFKGALAFTLTYWEDWKPTDNVLRLRSILAF